MKKIVLILVSAVVTVSFTACGSSNNSTPTEENQPVATSTPVVEGTTLQKIDIDVNCTTPPAISTYIELQKGDKIVSKEVNTSIRTFHDENDVKSVCLEHGKAYIEREE
ncbi:hypothetical protein GSY74_01030 [Sulfurovum sp. bin170]|uniref:hypothetical protein n=1 Tax=Sulfurovum sp. bin170 TaxID=2695268 RepID=UPI0013DFF5DD|nr:hypothetical protein [Sulfurovum sp. bin170]NEW59851.1 hypothetical protein [Sulfurovum sp. bin170]